MLMFSLLLAAQALTTDDAAARVCLDARIRKAVAGMVGTWSENYAFARVLIGKDGQYGMIDSVKVVSFTPEAVTCQGSFQLIKPNRRGGAYAVRVNGVTYTARLAEDSANIQLEDLPARLDGTGLSQRDLMSRFTINDQPYVEIFDENVRRLGGEP